MSNNSDNVSIIVRMHIVVTIITDVLHALQVNGLTFDIFHNNIVKIFIIAVDSFYRRDYISNGAVTEYDRM